MLYALLSEELDAFKPCPHWPLCNSSWTTAVGSVAAAVFTRHTGLSCISTYGQYWIFNFLIFLLLLWFAIFYYLFPKLLVPEIYIAASVVKMDGVAQLEKNAPCQNLQHSSDMQHKLVATVSLTTYHLACWPVWTEFKVHQALWVHGALWSYRTVLTL